ncbi:MAG: hypothetical protein ABFC96_02390, partial [Thermoguttaceae bacterium]
MVLRAFIQNCFANAVKSHAGKAIVQAIQSQPDPPAPAEAPEPCHVGLVFALGIESGCFEDLLHGAVTIRAGAGRSTAQQDDCRVVRSSAFRRPFHSECRLKPE